MTTMERPSLSFFQSRSAVSAGMLRDSASARQARSPSDNPRRDVPGDQLGGDRGLLGCEGHEFGLARREAREHLVRVVAITHEASDDLGEIDGRQAAFGEVRRDAFSALLPEQECQERRGVERDHSRSDSRRRSAMS